MSRPAKIMALAFGIIAAQPLFGHPLRDAYDAFRSKKYGDAEQKFRQYLQSEPDDWDQVYNAGVALFQDKKYAEASAMFERAKQSPSPDLKSQAAYNSAMVDIVQKNWEKAEKSLLEALAYDNNNKAIQDNLQWVRKQQNSEKQKEKENKQAEDSKPNEEQKKEESGHDQKEDQQKQANQDQKGEQKQANQDANGAKQKEDAQEQKAQQQSAEKSNPAEQGKDKQAQEQKNAQQRASDPEAKDAAKPAEAQSAAESAKSLSQTGEDSSEKKSEKESQKQAQSVGKVLTEQDLKRQEIDKVLRSIDDKIGRYPIGEMDQQGSAQRNGRDW